MTPANRPKLGLYIDLGQYPTDYIAATTERRPEANRWPDILEKARLADELGFDSVWIPDHFIFGVEENDLEGFWECTTMLAALAASTSRVKIGTLVICTAFRNPALLAKMADTIDQISNGRLILGLGAGYYDPEFEAFGYRTGKLASRFDEAIQIIHDLLRYGVVDFDGEFYQARHCELRPRGPSLGGPPIMIAARGPRMMRLTARYADLWNEVFVNADPDHVTKYRDLKGRLDAACEESGRDPASLGRTVAVFVQVTNDAGDNWNREGQLVSGSAAAITRFLDQFTAEGVSQIIVAPAPQTPAGIESLAPVLERWRS